MDEKKGNKNTKRGFDSSYAERWLDADHFIYQGVTYQLNLDFTISRVDHAI